MNKKLNDKERDELRIKQIYMSLPTCANLFTKIKQTREQAINYKDINKKDLKVEYDADAYKNIVSILGERGSGKSTLFKWIKCFLKEGITTNFITSEDEEISINEMAQAINEAYNNQDIILNTIVPEMLVEGIDLLGMILLNIQDYIKENIKTVRGYYRTANSQGSMRGSFESCMYTQETVLEQKWQSLFDSYVKKDGAYNNIIQNKYTSLTDYANNKQQLLNSELLLEDQLLDLFSELAKVFSDDKNDALIYIFIDDIDINRQRCGEAIRTVLRYLRHPNVMVFISAAPNKLNDELIKDEMIYQKMGDISNLLNKEEIRRDTASYVRELLKKVMPAANRFELLKLNNRNKQNFITVATDKLINKKSFSEILKEKIAIKKFDMPEWLYDIFDDKPRGLAITMEYLIGLEKQKGEEISDKELLNLVKIIVETNKVYEEKKEFILHTLITYAANHINIHYDKFIKVIISEIKTDKLQAKQVILILKLLYFIERILQSKTKSSNSSDLGINDATLYSQITVETKNAYGKILNLIIAEEDKPIYPEIDAEEVLELYEKLTQYIAIEDQKKIYSDGTYFDIYKNQVLEFWGTKIPSRYGRDVKWRESITELMNKFNNTKQERKGILLQLMNIFNDFEYDSEILFKRVATYLIESRDTEVHKDKVLEIYNDIAYRPSFKEIINGVSEITSNNLSSAKDLEKSAEGVIKKFSNIEETNIPFQEWGDHFEMIIKSLEQDYVFNDLDIKSKRDLCVKKLKNLNDDWKNECNKILIDFNELEDVIDVEEQVVQILDVRIEAIERELIDRFKRENILNNCVSKTDLIIQGFDISMNGRKLYIQKMLEKSKALVEVNANLVNKIVEKEHGLLLDNSQLNFINNKSKLTIIESHKKIKNFVEKCLRVLLDSPLKCIENGVVKDFFGKNKFLYVENYDLLMRAIKSVKSNMSFEGYINKGDAKEFIYLLEDLLEKKSDNQNLEWEKIALEPSNDEDTEKINIIKECVDSYENYYGEHIEIYRDKNQEISNFIESTIMQNRIFLGLCYLWMKLEEQEHDYIYMNQSSVQKTIENKEPIKSTLKSIEIVYTTLGEYINGYLEHQYYSIYKKFLFEQIDKLKIKFDQLIPSYTIHEVDVTQLHKMIAICKKYNENMVIVLQDIEDTLLQRHRIHRQQLDNSIEDIEKNLGAMNLSIQDSRKMDDILNKLIKQENIGKAEENMKLNTSIKSIYEEELKGVISCMKLLLAYEVKNN